MAAKKLELDAREDRGHRCTDPYIELQLHDRQGV